MSDLSQSQSSTSLSSSAVEELSRTRTGTACRCRIVRKMIISSAKRHIECKCYCLEENKTLLAVINTLRDLLRSKNEQIRAMKSELDTAIKRNSLGRRDVSLQVCIDAPTTMRKIQYNERLKNQEENKKNNNGLLGSERKLLEQDSVSPSTDYFDYILNKGKLSSSQYSLSISPFDQMKSPLSSRTSTKVVWSEKTDVAVALHKNGLRPVASAHKDASQSPVSSRPHRIGNKRGNTTRALPAKGKDNADVILLDSDDDERNNLSKAPRHDRKPFS